jgi:hypothetical protein
MYGRGQCGPRPKATDCDEDSDALLRDTLTTMILTGVHARATGVEHRGSYPS